MKHDQNSQKSNQSECSTPILIQTVMPLKYQLDQLKPQSSSIQNRNIFYQTFSQTNSTTKSYKNKNNNASYNGCNNSTNNNKPLLQNLSNVSDQLDNSNKSKLQHSKTTKKSSIQRIFNSPSEQPNNNNIVQFSKREKTSNFATQRLGLLQQKSMPINNYLTERPQIQQYQKKSIQDSQEAFQISPTKIKSDFLEQLKQQQKENNNNNLQTKLNSQDVLTPTVIQKKHRRIIAGSQQSIQHIASGSTIDTPKSQKKIKQQQFKRQYQITSDNFFNQSTDLKNSLLLQENQQSKFSQQVQQQQEKNSSFQRQQSNSISKTQNLQKRTTLPNLNSYVKKRSNLKNINSSNSNNNIKIQQLVQQQYSENQNNMTPNSSIEPQSNQNPVQQLKNHQYFNNDSLQNNNMNNNKNEQQQQYQNISQKMLKNVLSSQIKSSTDRKSTFSRQQSFERNPVSQNTTAPTSTDNQTSNSSSAQKQVFKRSKFKSLTQRQQQQQQQFSQTQQSQFFQKQQLITNFLKQFSSSSKIEQEQQSENQKISKSFNNNSSAIFSKKNKTNTSLTIQDEPEKKKSCLVNKVEQSQSNKKNYKSVFFQDFVRKYDFEGNVEREDVLFDKQSNSLEKKNLKNKNLQEKHVSKFKF